MEHARGRMYHAVCSTEYRPVDWSKSWLTHLVFEIYQQFGFGCACIVINSAFLQTM